MEVMTKGEERKRGRSDGGGGGRWEDMIPEILALIFVRVPAEELVSRVAMVCRSWLEAVAGPYCWTDIDLRAWSGRGIERRWIDSAVWKLVRWSRNSFRRLSVLRLGDSTFAFAANRARCLKELLIPMSDVTDNTVQRYACSLVGVTLLDISHCLNITSKGIEALGKQCKSLVDFRRNMYCPRLEQPLTVKINENEAMAIAETMRGIRRLELGFGAFGDCGLNAILTKCKALTHLDIQGCWNVEMKGDLRDRCQRLAVFADPQIEDYDDWGYQDSRDGEVDGYSSSCESVCG